MFVINGIIPPPPPPPLVHLLMSEPCSTMDVTAEGAARYNTWLPIKLTPKGVVFSFLFFSDCRAFFLARVVLAYVLI